MASRTTRAKMIEHMRAKTRQHNTNATFGPFSLVLIVACCLFAMWLWFYSVPKEPDPGSNIIKDEEEPLLVKKDSRKDYLSRGKEAGDTFESRDEINTNDNRQEREISSGIWSGIFWIFGVIIALLVIVLLIFLLFASFVVFLYEFIVCTIFSLVIHIIVAIPVKLFTGKTPEFVAPTIQPPLPLRVFTKVMKVLDLFTDGLQSLVTFLQGTTNRRVNSDNRSQSGRNRGRSTPRAHSFFNLGLRERITGNYFACKKSSVTWNQEDFSQVGVLTVVTVKLVCGNGKPYCLQPSDEFDCNVTNSTGRTTLVCVLEPAELTGVSEVKISYTARIVGKYSVKLTVNGLNIGNSPYERTYLPGPVDCSKSIVLSNSNTMVARRGVYNAVSVEAKDTHGNNTIMDVTKLDMVVVKNEEHTVVETELVRSQQDEGYELLFKLEQDGIYFGTVMYDSDMVGTDGFTIICLDEQVVDLVEKQVEKRELNNWYEARLLSASPHEKGKKVYCYITPRQLQVREYFLKFIPKRRVYTCRVCPSTKIQFREDRKFVIDDGYQEPITLVSDERGVIGATFSKYMLKNIGGSENFKSKRGFFFKEVASLSGSSSRRTVKVKVSRSELFSSGYRALKGFSTSDWRSKIEVSFIGEQGLDWGGVRREFFTLLCCELFESSGLFARFSEDHQALVHPSPVRPPLKLKYFEFCGKVIGKCLYESALGDIILVKARFTRSFLGQIIGLRVNYRYFETDDPELYTTKIKYIKENDVSDLELVFAEEVFSTSANADPEVVPLKPGGASIEVTNENKMEYLNCLAQYRLVHRVKDEIEAFLKGLNEIIPDNLLSIFDENELELLMSGISKIDVSDWKASTLVNGYSAHFLTMVSWFWTAVTNYNQEERTRLLQFVTGSSQLPPEGFAALNPKFTISHAPVCGRLPSAHTCFNEICLSDHTTYEGFESSLRLAISEGSEGFGMV